MFISTHCSRRQPNDTPEGTRRIVKAHPYTVVVPLLLLGLVLGLGVYGVTELNASYVQSTRAHVTSVAFETASWYKQQLLAAVQPVVQLCSVVQHNPQRGPVEAMFTALAASLLDTSSVLHTHVVRLEPGGVVRLESPAASLDAMDGVDMLAAAAGNDAVVAAARRQLTLLGPVPVFDGGYGILARQPIFISGVQDNATFGFADSPNPHCGVACAYDLTTRTKLWGFATALFSVDELSTSSDSPLHTLNALGYRYELRAMGTQHDKPIVASATPPRDAVEVTVTLHDNKWVLRVAFDEDGTSPRYTGMLVGAVLLAVVVAVLTFAVLVSRRRHKELLEALLPREVIKTLRGEEGAVIRAMGTHILSADTPANMLLVLLGELLEGRMPSMRHVVFIRTALMRGCDLHAPLNLRGHIKEANLDADVALALMQQLGGSNGSTTSLSASSRATGRRGNQQHGGSRARDANPDDIDADSAIGGTSKSGAPYQHTRCGAVEEAPRRQQAYGTLSSALALILTPQPAAWRDIHSGSTENTTFDDGAVGGTGYAAKVAATGAPSSMPPARVHDGGAPSQYSPSSLWQRAASALMAPRDRERDREQDPSNRGRQSALDLVPLPIAVLRGISRRGSMDMAVRHASPSHAGTAPCSSTNGVAVPGKRMLAAPRAPDITVTMAEMNSPGCSSSNVLAQQPPGDERTSAGMSTASGPADLTGEFSSSVVRQSTAPVTTVIMTEQVAQMQAQHSRRISGVVSLLTRRVPGSTGGTVAPTAAACNDSGSASPQHGTQSFSVGSRPFGRSGSGRGSHGALALGSSEAPLVHQPHSRLSLLGRLASGRFLSGAAEVVSPATLKAMAIAKQSMPPPAAMIEEVERLLAAADNWTFDTWALQEATQGHALSALGFFLMQRAGLVKRFKIKPVVLVRLLRAIESGYMENPYHNAVHAADVLQTLHVIVHSAQLHVHYLDPLGLLAAYYAAIVHDYAHPGLTGDFLVATSDPLAIRYNDSSPLENHHCAASFSLLQRPELDVLAPLSKPDRASFRKQVIELVLATDMKQHFSILSHFNTVHRLAAYSQQQQTAASNASQVNKSGVQKAPSRRTTSHALSGESHSSTYPRPADRMDAAFAAIWAEHPAPKPVDDTERLLSLQIAIKCADIGHLGEDLDVHKRWLAGLEEEFFRQGDMEKELGIPISPLFDRTKQGVSKSQVGFYDFVALPLCHALSSAFSGAQPLMKCFLENYNTYRMAEGQAPLEVSGKGRRGPSHEGPSSGERGGHVASVVPSVPSELFSPFADEAA